MLLPQCLLFLSSMNTLFYCCIQIQREGFYYSGPFLTAFSSTNEKDKQSAHCIEITIIQPCDASQNHIAIKGNGRTISL